MSVIIRLQGLALTASASDIRRFFEGLHIPPGGVHIIGGEKGEAFIAFSTDEDARQGMMHNMGPLNGEPVQLFLSSKSEMQTVIEQARNAESQTAGPPGPNSQPVTGMNRYNEGFNKKETGNLPEYPGRHRTNFQGNYPGSDHQDQRGGYGDGDTSTGQHGYHDNSGQSFHGNYPENTGNFRGSKGEVSGQFWGDKGSYPTNRPNQPDFKGRHQEVGGPQRPEMRGRHQPDFGSHVHSNVGGRHQPDLGDQQQQPDTHQLYMGGGNYQQDVEEEHEGRGKADFGGHPKPGFRGHYQSERGHPNFRRQPPDLAHPPASRYPSNSRHVPDSAGSGETRFSGPGGLRDQFGRQDPASAPEPLMKDQDTFELNKTDNFPESSFEQNRSRPPFHKDPADTRFSGMRFPPGRDGRPGMEQHSFRQRGPNTASFPTSKASEEGKDPDYRLENRKFPRAGNMPPGGRGSIPPLMKDTDMEATPEAEVPAQGDHDFRTSLGRPGMRGGILQDFDPRPQHRTDGRERYGRGRGRERPDDPSSMEMRRESSRASRFAPRDPPGGSLPGERDWDQQSSTYKGQSQSMWQDTEHFERNPPLGEPVPQSRGLLGDAPPGMGRGIGQNEDYDSRPPLNQDPYGEDAAMWSERAGGERSGYGPPRFGQDRFGRERPSIDQSGSERFGQEGLGSERFGMSRGGPDRFGSSRSGPSRFGPNRSSQERFGTPRHEEFDQEKSGLDGFGPDRPSFERSERHSYEGPRGRGYGFDRNEGRGTVRGGMSRFQERDGDSYGSRNDRYRREYRSPGRGNRMNFPGAGDEEEADWQEDYSQRRGPMLDRDNRISGRFSTPDRHQFEDASPRDFGDGPRGSKRSRSSDQPCFFLKNFPLVFSYKDIRRFFYGADIPFDGLKLLNDDRGRRTGNAYMKLVRESDSAKVLSKDGNLFQGHKISVTRCSFEDFDKAVDSYVPGMNESPAMSFPPKRSRLEDTSPVRPEKNPLIVQVKGLGPSTNKDDINRFFVGMKAADGGNSVFIEYDSKGLCTGVAFVEFQTYKDFRDALNHHGRRIGPRVIDVSIGRKEDVNSLIERQKNLQNIPDQERRKSLTENTSSQGRNQRLSDGTQSQSRNQRTPENTPQQNRSHVLAVGETQKLLKDQMNSSLSTGPKGGGSGDKSQTDSSSSKLESISVKSNSQSDGSGDGSKAAEMKAFHCVHLQGLPLLATFGDMKEFFKDLSIASGGMQLVHDGAGKPLGEGFVEFTSAGDLEKALKRNKSAMGRHVVVVKPISKVDMIDILRRARQSGVTSFGPGTISANTTADKPIPPGVLNRQWFYLRCNNFPPNVSIGEIMNFFRGFNAIPESIRLHYSGDGNPTGNAVVGFSSKMDGMKALQDLNNHMCKGHRVTLHPASF